MLKKNKKQINSLKFGNLVLLRTVDRGAADAINILCIILEKKDIMFRLGCEVGVLNTMFPFNVIEKTQLVSSFSKESIPDVQVGVREAIRLLSIGHGQGVLKCNCKTGKCNKNFTCKKAIPTQECNKMSRRKF